MCAHTLSHYTFLVVHIWYVDATKYFWTKNNGFETSKVFADMRHTSHIRQKWENQKMKIIKFSNLYLVSANTFDVSNRLFLFHPTLGLSKKVFRSFIALLQRDISNRDITWFLKIPKISICFAQNSKKGKKMDLQYPYFATLKWYMFMIFYDIKVTYLDH